MKHYLFILVSILILSSCKYKQNKTSEVDNIPADSILEETAPINNDIFSANERGIFILETDSPFIYISLHSASPHSNSWFLSDTLNQLYISRLEIKQNTIDTLQSVLIAENDWSYLSIDESSVRETDMEGIPFLYLSASESAMGSAVIDHSVNFYFINLQTLEFYKLVYTGRSSFKCEDCIDGYFEDSEELQQLPFIAERLKELSRTSKLIYQRTSKDDDPYYHMNYETKWNKDNKSDNAFAYGHAEVCLPIHSTYYTKNLFELNRTKEHSMENDRYKISTYFRGNVIGYDKQKELYFPIFIESCAVMCDKTVEFITENSIRLIYSEESHEEDYTYDILLDDIIFDQQTGD